MEASLVYALFVVYQCMSSTLSFIIMMFSVATALTFSREDWFSLLLLVLCKVPLHFNNNVHTSVMVTLQRSNVQKLTRPQNWKIQLNILALTDQ